MAWDTDLRNNNQIYNSTYPSGGYERSRQSKIFVVVGLLLAITLLIIIVSLSLSNNQQSKYEKSATIAARKQIPDAQVTNIKVAGGFATATVSDPSGGGQASAGNTTIFRVNKDGSMTQLAIGSSFSPLALLNLGIPLKTQALLNGRTVGQVEQELASQCGYNNGVIGFNGFEGSFSPGQWQIDAATLDGLMQKLSNVINSENTKATSAKTVICVNAIQKNSNLTTDPTTYTSTFTLQVQFITRDGTLTSHVFTFTNDSPSLRKYTLDGQPI